MEVKQYIMWGRCSAAALLTDDLTTRRVQWYETVIDTLHVHNSVMRQNIQNFSLPEIEIKSTP